MKHRPTPHFTERGRLRPEQRLVREVLRLDPELRAAYAADGVGGFSSTGLRQRDAANVAAALRHLPDDAGAAAVARTLAPFLNRS